MYTALSEVNLQCIIYLSTHSKDCIYTDMDSTDMDGNICKHVILFIIL